MCSIGARMTKTHKSGQPVYRTGQGYEKTGDGASWPAVTSPTSTSLVTLGGQTASHDGQIYFHSRVNRRPAWCHLCVQS